MKGQIQLYLGKHMNYTIIRKDCFQIIGIKIEAINDQKKGLKEIKKLWRHLMLHKKEREKLLSYMNEEPYGLIGMSVYYKDPKDTYMFDYYIGTSSSSSSDAYETYTVPAGVWAVFPCTRKTLVYTQQEIITQWSNDQYDICNTGYEQGNIEGVMPDLEVYGKGNDVEIWIALKEK